MFPETLASQYPHTITNGFLESMMPECCLPVHGSHSCFGVLGEHQTHPTSRGGAKGHLWTESR